MPPKRNWRMRIQDILSAIDDVEKFTDTVGSFESFLNNKLVYYAVLKALEIIGEASHHLPNEIKEKYPEIPWVQLKNFRNHLAHEYFGIDAEVVWNASKDELPALKNTLIKILDSAIDQSN